MTAKTIQFKYDTHYQEGQKFFFKKLDIDMAGLLFLPDNFDGTQKYPAIVVTHPGGGVKEQCSSLYAWNMARAGYVAVCFDASYQVKVAECRVTKKTQPPALKISDPLLIIWFHYLTWMKMQSVQLGYVPVEDIH